MSKKKQTHFAKNNKDEIIEAIKGMTISSSLYCLGCGKKVQAYAINTKVQRTHFRHLKGIGGGDGGCGESESYIHNLSKIRFAENYKNISIFNLYREIMLTCTQSKYPSCKKKSTEILNLKKMYPYIKVEKRDGSFIPDCLLYNNKNEKIYIEIKYKSSISDAKRDSGIPIIEIEVQKELDIDRTIKYNTIKQNDRGIKLYNFNSIPTNRIYDCQGVCPEEEKLQQEEERLKQEKIKKDRLKREQEAQRIYAEKKETIPICKIQYKIDIPQKREKIIGTQSVQIFKPKKCYQCKSDTTHYMNIGRVIMNKEYKILSQDKEPFKDEIIFSERFSIAKRVPDGKTNTYYCPECNEKMANNRFIGNTTRFLYSEEEMIIGQIGLFKMVE